MSGRIITPAAKKCQSLCVLYAPKQGRYTALAHLRTPAEHRPRSLMFRDELDCPELRVVIVMHVQDDPTVAGSVQVALGDEGWAVETCRDAAEALERLESGARYDVLIFDNQLSPGGMDGVELIRRARALAHRQQTPTIMLCGHADVEMPARRALLIIDNLERMDALSIVCLLALSARLVINPRPSSAATGSAE